MVSGARSFWGYPSPVISPAHRGYPPNPHSREAERLCSAGGMPLVFTREDYLVVIIIAARNDKIDQK